MECHQDILSEKKAAYANFSRKVIHERVPVSGSIAITHRCSFNCIHCYVGDQEKVKDSVVNELSAIQWKRIIDELIDAGCLSLLFTGGDPMIRSDFTDIYRYARKKGMLVSIFTNGYLVSDEILNTFNEYPPTMVDISIYGATPGTFQAVTRRSNALEVCMANIDKLIKNGIRTQLKTVIMTKNYHEFDAMKNLAEKLGVRFRFDAMIFPRLDGDLTPIKYRVKPEEVVEKNLSENYRSKWEDYFFRMKNVVFSNMIYNCGAGLTNFHIDPDGILKPCLMINGIHYDLVKGNFSDGWHHVIPRLKEKMVPKEYECSHCKRRSLCGYCPAFFQLETGSEIKKSEFLCEIGHLMYNQINDPKANGDQSDV